MNFDSALHFLLIAYAVLGIIVVVTGLILAVVVVVKIMGRLK